MTAGDASGPIDVATLRSVQRDLAEMPGVASASFEPSAEDPRQVWATLDSHRYPDRVRGARLDVRWFANGDFSVHYVERHDDGSTWQCRWDRHENPHDDRLHFHRPPDCERTTSLDLSPHVRDVLPTVLQWVEERQAVLWTDE